MSLAKEIIKIDIVNHDNLLDRIIIEWNSKYKKYLEKLSNKFGIKYTNLSISDSDSEKDNKISNYNELSNKLIRQAIKCKAYAETEYKSIKDIRSELEDCQMIKELGLSLRKLEEEKCEQNIKLKHLNGKNLELLQEKQNLEKSLQELSLHSKLSNNLSSSLTTNSEYNRKAALTAKLETYTNRTQIPKRTNKNPEYCHIAPNINLFSDSELSISEEDSLEKDRNKDTHIDSFDGMQCIESPTKFGSGIISKSTPLKECSKSNGTSTNNIYSTAISNLTQDLQDIQKYFDKKDDEVIVAPTHIVDWEMSQISIDDFKDHNTNEFILQGKEDPDDDHLLTLPSNDIINNGNTDPLCNTIPKIDGELDKLNDDLQKEKDKYLELVSHISSIFGLIQNNDKVKVNDVPTCSGDSPSLEIVQDPLEQVRLIKLSIDTRNAHNKMTDNSEDKVDLEAKDLNSNIFKILSETSVRLLAEIVTKINKTNLMISENRFESHRNAMNDFTESVTEYLQYLMSLDSLDFNDDTCRCHPIYDLLVELEVNVRKISEKKMVEDKGLSQSLETFYQEQLKKCYDDISRLKQQLESTQHLFTSKLPLDANEALFEAKQKLQIELESVDREYARQMARERKRLEDSENMYTELLIDHEKMQKKYNNNVIALNQQIEQLERKIEADRKFIDQQQFEWELERNQHTQVIENLNKCRMKKSSSCSDNLSDSMDSPKKEKLQKSNSVPKPKYENSFLESNEIISNEISTQTIDKDVLIFKEHLMFIDLFAYDGFLDLREEIKRNDNCLLNVIHIISDIIFELIENHRFNISADILQDFNTKDFVEIFQISDCEWENMQLEILNVRDFLNKFISDQVNLKMNFDRIQEELDSNIINMEIKQDVIKAHEDEILNLIEFQRNLSKDYDVLQSMLEEKQNELDTLSTKLSSQPVSDDQEELILSLKKDLNEKQNIIDERDEDLYVLKEEKELVEQDLQVLKEKYDSIIIQHKDIYQDLEKEMKDTQYYNSELQSEIRTLITKEEDKMKQIVKLSKSQEQLNSRISELHENNEMLMQKNESLIDQYKLMELRLSEMKEQHKMEINKLNSSLEEMEGENRKLTNECKSNKISLNTIACQTQMLNDKHCQESLMGFVTIQDKLVRTIDRLKKAYIHEKELRCQVESKNRQFASQYETLSNKVFSLGIKVNDTKPSMDKDGDIDITQSLESIDVNDLLNESQLSIDEDIEFNTIFKDYCDIDPNMIGNKDIATQTDSIDKLSGLKDNIYGFYDVGYSSLSDWLPDLLKEVEIVLQSCIVGDELPREIIPKMERFRNILEQMYKKQLSILVNKITTIEQEIQFQRKNNQELKHKSDFIMMELQEKESSQKNLRIRLDQELSNNNRLADNNKHLSEQNRLMKTDLNNQISHLKDELERERNKSTDASRHLRNEMHSKDQLEAALSVANDRIKLVEQSNIELIKKSRQQADYQQKEMDSFNIEYAEIFRRCNNYKIQMETLQQNLQYQMAENEKTKSELQETIQSNTEYRDKMNEFIKIYQEKRKKLETEVNELHQLLQISCRREITFVKENETLRVKCQSFKNACKDYERKIKELEVFVSDLHVKHEEDRHDWLNLINGSIDAKDKDDGILSQVNWLLKMLHLRIELLVLHYIPDVCSNVGDNKGEFIADSQSKTIVKGRPYSADNNMNRNSSELLMLLQSVKSMQSMINLYLNRNQNSAPQNGNITQSFINKNMFPNIIEKHIFTKNNSSNRPKPTGSSDSLDSISDTESLSEMRETVGNNQEIDNLSTKIYVIQTNKIVELQINLDHCERWRQQLIDEKKYIISQLSEKLSNFITTPLLTEHQQIIIQKNFFKFKFRAVIITVIASIKFYRLIRPSCVNVSLSSRLNKAGSLLPQPKFSTNINIKKVNQFQNGSSKKRVDDISTCNIRNKGKTQQVNQSQKMNSDSSKRYKETLKVDAIKSNSKASNSEKQSESADSGVDNRNQSNKQRCNLSPIASESPIFERSNIRSNNNNISSFPRTGHRPSYTGIPSVNNSLSKPFRKSLPVSFSYRDSLTSSFDSKNIADKSSTFSSTLKQIDDFGKRLEKYTDVANGI